MKKAQRIALIWLLLSSSIFVVWGTALERSSPGGMVDFRAVYYGARCLIQHKDPYSNNDFLHVYQADGGKLPSDPTMAHMFLLSVPVCINLPTTLFLVAPFSLLAWGPAHVLWMALVAGSLILAAFLMGKFAEDHARDVSIFLVCVVLANSEILFAWGNTAGIAVSFCIVAVWCFLKERFVAAGVLCMALGLAIKPHDVGLVWLFFLLAGGTYRKRALQTLVVAIALGLPAILWVAHVAPNWIPELHSNIQATAAQGGLNDPGPASIAFRTPAMVIDLQAVISVFRDDPRIYNSASYLICGVLVAVWSIATMKSRVTPARAWLALAAIAAFSMLPVYHRLYDAKLLLLTVPACAMLWAEGGPVRWIAFLLNTAGIVVTGDIPSASLVVLSKDLRGNPSGTVAQILTVLRLRPAPLILLALGVFYLWMYVRRAVPDVLEAQESGKAALLQPDLQGANSLP